MKKVLNKNMDMKVNYKDIYVPSKYSYLFNECKSIKYFKDIKLNGYNQIINHIKRKGICIVTERIEILMEIIDNIYRKKKDLIKIQGTYKNRRDINMAYNNILDSLMILCKEDKALINPEIKIPYLYNFVEESYSNIKDKLYVISLQDFLKIQESLSNKHYVNAINGYLVVHYNVLIPSSQQTIDLMKKSFCELKSSMPYDLKVLDMGCGSGVLSILASMIFRDKNVKVTSTDHLQEAVATTMLNKEKYESNMVIDKESITILEANDMFNSVYGKFDLIIFNAPWVIAKPKNRLETALNDANQSTIKRFIQESKKYLNKSGHIIIGYSNHSGLKYIKELEDCIYNSGLKVNKIYKDKIQTRAKNRKWQAIYAYDLIL